MWPSLFALAVVTSSSLVTTYFKDFKRRWIKPVVFGSTIVCALFGAYQIWTEAVAKEQAIRQSINNSKMLDEARRELKTANAKLALMEPSLALVNATVGDLASLKELSGGSQYYVRIAYASTDRGRRDLYNTLRRIQSEFKGAQSSGMAAVRKWKSGSVCSGGKGGFELVFGQGLNFVAADAYHRLAVAHHLSNGVPQICPEAVAN